MSPEIGYEHHVFVCQNERPAGHPRGCCGIEGAQIRAWFREAMMERGLGEGTRVNAAGCLDYCELGPIVVLYPSGTWYCPRTREDVVEIVESHMQRGEVVERLVAREQPRG